MIRVEVAQPISASARRSDGNHFMFIRIAEGALHNGKWLVKLDLNRCSHLHHFKETEVGLLLADRFVLFWNTRDVYRGTWLRWWGSSHEKTKRKTVANVACGSLASRLLKLIQTKRV